MKFPRVLALTAALAAIPLVAAAPAGAAVSINTYTCVFPLTGAQPASIRFAADLPASFSSTAPNAPVPVSAELTLGGDIYDGLTTQRIASLYDASITGTATVVGPNGARTPVSLTMDVPPYPIPDESTPLVVPATGSFGSFSLDGGEGEGGLLAPASLTFTYHGKDAAGDPINVSLDPLELYDMKRVAVVPCNADPAGQSLPIGSVPFGTPPTPTPTTAPVVSQRYTATGSATLRSKAKGTLPLAGTLDTTVTGAGALAGALSLVPATTKLTAYGFLPVRAKIAISPSAPVSGTLVGSVLHATATARVAFPAVSVFGLALGGPTCQTRTPSTFTLDSQALSPATGATVTGSFGVANLTGCSAFNGFLSQLVASANDSLMLQLK